MSVLLVFRVKGWPTGGGSLSSCLLSWMERLIKMWTTFAVMTFSWHRYVKPGTPSLFLRPASAGGCPTRFEPGTTEAYSLLNVFFSCNCSSLRGQDLGFCNAPRENLKRNGCCINKVKLNWFESVKYQFVSCWGAFMLQSNIRKCHIFLRELKHQPF